MQIVSRGVISGQQRIGIVRVSLGAKSCWWTNLFQPWIPFPQTATGSHQRLAKNLAWRLFSWLMIWSRPWSRRSVAVQEGEIVQVADSAILANPAQRQWQICWKVLTMNYLQPFRAFGDWLTALRPSTCNCHYWPCSLRFSSFISISYLFKYTQREPATGFYRVAGSSDHSFHGPF